MGGGVNKVFLLGRIASKEPGFDRPDGRRQVDAVLRTVEHFRASSGTVAHEEKHNLVFVGRLGEVADDVMLLDDAVCLEGRMRTSRRGVDGDIVYRTEIVVGGFHIIHKDSGKRTAPRPPAAAGAPAA